jgi:hypothetical protein
MAADQTFSVPVVTMPAMGTMTSVVPTSIVNVGLSQVTVTAFPDAGGGGGGSTRPSTGLLYPRGY